MSGNIATPRTLRRDIVSDDIQSFITTGIQIMKELRTYFLTGFLTECTPMPLGILAVLQM